jgi:hypothetical protein
MGIGPESYRKELLDQLKTVGITVQQGIPRSGGVADIFWPKSYDELAYSIYKKPLGPIIPENGRVLAAGKCQLNNVMIQYWQTQESNWFLTISPESIEANEIKSFSNTAPILDVLRLPQSKMICRDVIDKFAVVLHDPKDEIEVKNKLERLGVSGKILESESGYFYWYE